MSNPDTNSMNIAINVSGSTNFSENSVVPHIIMSIRYAPVWRTSANNEMNKDKSKKIPYPKTDDKHDQKT
jgi:hypothetical protein